MNLTLLYSSSNLDIYFDEDNQWIYSDWKGYQTEHYVRTGCDCMLNWLVARRATMVLNDNTRVLGIWIDAAEWVATDWFPRMQTAGLKHFAWVYSPARLSQVSTDETLKHAAPGTATVFYDRAEAEEWLRRQI